VKSIGIYTGNATELITGQIPNQSQCKLTGICIVSTGKDFYFYLNTIGKQVFTGFMCPTANQ
jgi:hypothetical protein